MKGTARFLGTLGLGLVAGIAVMFAVSARAAGIPEADGMTYTGYLEDGEGQPLTGAHSIAVQFWESADATEDLCTGKLDSAELQSGRFQVPLPVSCSAAVQGTPDIWISVDVDGASLGRTKLGSVPFALEAGHATSADTAVEADHAATAAAADGALGERLSAIEAAAPGDSAFRVSNEVGTTVPNGSPRTSAIWDAEQFDLGNEFNLATDTFTSVEGGYYQFSCSLVYVTGAGSYFLETALVLNGKSVDADNMLNVGANHQPVRIDTLLKLAPGDAVQCGAWQSSGGSLTLRSHATFPNEVPSTFSGVRVKPL